MISERVLFESAIERSDPAAREAFLAEACGTDSELRRRIELLVAAHETPDAFMSRPGSAISEMDMDSSAAQTHANGSDSSVSSPGRGVPFSNTERTLAAGSQFGRYRIEEVLGRGGMATVYLATDTRLNRRVAIKIPRFAPLEQPELAERFEREARTMASIHHRNLCTIHDVDEHEGVRYLSMAYLEGRTLAQVSERGEILSPRQIAELMRKLASATQRAHRAGVVHRDLKPANIMIDEEGEPIIMDFGLALTAHSDSRLTQSGIIMGTPAYMAPEQALSDSQQVGPASDIYSLGAIMYELLTGRAVFSGSTSQVLHQLVGNQPIAPPRSLRSNVDPALAAICMKALSRRPVDRFSSAGEFAAALARYLNGDEVLPVRRIPYWPAAALLGLSIFVALIVLRRSPTVEESIAPPIAVATPAPALINDEWSQPVNLGPGVNTKFKEENACVSADGLTMLFNRSGGANEQIWESNRASTNESFGPASILSEVINLRGYVHDCPFLSRDGLSLWFASNRPGGHGQHDLWVSRRNSTDEAWNEPTNLGPHVNTSKFEQTPSVTANELTLLFSGDEPRGVFRILQATRASRDEPFGEPRLLANVNDGKCSSFPRLTADGSAMVFVHCRRGEDKLSLCVATRASVSDEFGEPRDLAPPMNEFPVSGPSLSSDGMTLYFSSQRAGEFDLWTSTRVPR